MRVIHQQAGYRIIELPDTDADFDALCGDTFNPAANPDIPKERLESELAAFRDLVNAEGVYGYVLQFWNPDVDAGWEHLDSCWGFVGQYSASDTSGKFDHYIVNELKSQIPKEET